MKTATKRPEPIEKEQGRREFWWQVIVAKTVDQLPLNRQEKIFERHGARHLAPLKQLLFQSKVIGTDDTSVKVLDAKLLKGISRISTSRRLRRIHRFVSRTSEGRDAGRLLGVGAPILSQGAGFG